jgi:CubicO group peptidase (beta-lactamase class C family)
LQQAIERGTQMSLDDFVHRVVTGPLGMRRTAFQWDDRPAAQLAAGHDRDGRKLPRTMSSAASAASSLHTTVVDYARFIERMFDDLSDRRNGTPAGRLMIRPRILVDRALGLSWGLGWAVASHAKETVFLHWGSNPGFKSLVLGSVDRARGLVVLTNGDNGLELATALVPRVFGGEYPFLRFNMLHPDD